MIKKKNDRQRQFDNDRKPSWLVAKCRLQNKNKNCCDDGTDDAERDGEFRHGNSHPKVIALLEEVDVKYHSEDDPDERDHQQYP